MACIRRRRLADGRERFDVHHHFDGRKTTTTFDDRDQADAFAHVCNLRRHRWPLEPLLRLTGLTPREFAERHGLARSTVRQAAQQGVSDVQADHWATAEGYHPVNVWGWAWIAAADPPAAEATGAEAVA